VTPLPEELTGGWVRRSIARDGGPPHEPSVVWWLQAPSHYADLRLPVAADTPAEAFAGVTTWDPPALTWEHALDLDRSAVADTGRIRWDGQCLIEEGAGYVEVWARLPGSAWPALALSRERGRLVRTGSYALTMGDTGSGLTTVGWRLVDGSWVETLRWPTSSRGLPPPPDQAGLAAGGSVTLADGSTWHVDEVG
jgi:hypothetical protein